METHFGSLAKEASTEGQQQNKSVYTPSLMFVRDDEMVNANIGVFYDAPNHKHPDYYAFQLLTKMVGNYDIEENCEHLNTVEKQYNAMHGLLGELPDVTIQRSHHIAYSDSAIWGNYLFGNQVFARQMTYCGMHLPTVYCDYINQVEVYRARNRIYNDLLNKNGIFQTQSEIAPQIFYQGRRVPRSEVAKRIAHFDAYHIKNVCYEWLYDAEPSITAWGPIEDISHVGSYKYFKGHTMGTLTNAHLGLLN